MAKRSRMEWVKQKLGFEGLITVDLIGKSGGLTLMWKEKDQVPASDLDGHVVDNTKEIKPPSNKRVYKKDDGPNKKNNS
ncbi:hypothetical protein ACET3Z_011657 [Daucus carota]